MKDASETTKFCDPILQEILLAIHRQLIIYGCFCRKYCTLLLQSHSLHHSQEVIAAITYQIVPTDPQYAEIPIAAVSSMYQHKGFGSSLLLELKKRLQSVGKCTIFCWGDKESEGFWLKQIRMTRIWIGRVRGRILKERS